MKLYAAILFILISFQLSAQVEGTADYLIKYELHFAQDSTDRANKSLEMHSLYTGNTVSYYTSDAFLAIDTLMAKFRENPRAGMSSMRNNGSAMPRPEFIARVYKDLKNAQAWVNMQFLRDNYVYQEPGFPLQWEMTDETKTIGDYTAMKATTNFGGRAYEAWFTFDVPIQDGPFVFSGLPGLILEIADTQGDYEFNVTSIQQLKTPIEINLKDKDFKKEDKKNVIKAYTNFRKNPLGEFADRVKNMQSIPWKDGEMISGAEMLRRVKKEVATRNNYIEKW